MKKIYQRTKIFMPKVNNIDVLFACDRQINLKIYKKIRALERFLVGSNFKYYITTNGTKNIDNFYIDKNFIVLELSDSYFDFSRYEDFLKGFCKADIAILINDTLGSGRKFNTGLFLHTWLSILLLRFGIIELSGPFDRDAARGWISPYLVLGKVSVLKNFEWTNWKLAKSKLSSIEICDIEDWINNKWRSRVGASKSQRDVKRKILYAERMLIHNESKKYKIFCFSRRNPLRWLNRINI